MYIILTLLFLISLFILPVFLIKPTLIKKFVGVSFSRKQILVIFSFLIIFSFSGVIATAPATTNNSKSIKSTSIGNDTSSDINGSSKNNVDVKLTQTSTTTLTVTTITPTPTLIKTPTPTITSTYTPTHTNTPSPTNNNDYYKNSDGNSVHSPENSNNIPAGATAQCVDGTYSFSQHRSGTCSHHGGVQIWY